MSRADEHQVRANEKAYEDGQRCRRKGLGIRKSGKYDHLLWAKLFKRGFVRTSMSVDSDEAKDCWVDGCHDEDHRLNCAANGVYPCGRPL